MSEGINYDKRARSVLGEEVLSGKSRTAFAEDTEEIAAALWCIASELRALRGWISANVQVKPGARGT